MRVRLDGRSTILGSGNILSWRLVYCHNNNNNNNNIFISRAKNNIVGTNDSLTYGPRLQSRNDIGNWTCINYLQYVQSRWGLRTPSLLRAGYPTLLTWRGRYDLTRLKTSRWLPQWPSVYSLARCWLKWIICYLQSISHRNYFVYQKAWIWVYHYTITIEFDESFQS